MVLIEAQGKLNLCYSDNTVGFAASGFTVTETLLSTVSLALVLSLHCGKILVFLTWFGYTNIFGDLYIFGF